MNRPAGRPGDLDIARRRLERAERIVNDCLDHLSEQQALIPTLRGTSYDETRGSHSIPDPTAGTVVALDRVSYLRLGIGDAIATINVAINVLEAACTDALRYRASAASAPESTQERCIGDNTPAGASCTQIPSERPDGHGGRIVDGRCLDCGVRYDQRLADDRAERDAAKAARVSRIEQNRRLRRMRGAAS